MKKLITILLLLLLGLYVNAQTKTADQKDDDITVLKKNVSNVSTQVKSLQGKVNTATTDYEKRLSSYGEDIKILQEKVDKSASAEEINNKFIVNEQKYKERFNEISHSLIQRKYITLILSFLIAFFVLIAAYYFNSNLNKNVENLGSAITESKTYMHTQLDEMHKQVSAMKIHLDNEVKAIKTLVNDKLEETSRSINNDITQFKESVSCKITENSKENEKNIQGLKESFNAQINDTKLNINSSIDKSSNDLKAGLEKQLAVFKNDIYKEISDIKSKIIK
jgi:hypothetical protein